MNKSKVQKLSQSAKDQILSLASLAEKDAEGAAELYSAAALATEWLKILCEKEPAVFSAIAQEKFSWPLMYDPHPEAKRENAEFIKKLKLGTNTHINLSSGKTFSWRVPANIVAFRLHRLAQSLRRAPMRSWTTRDWLPVAQCGIGRSSPNVHSYNEKYEKQLNALEEWGQRGAGSLLPPLSKNTAPQWATAATELFRIAYGENFEGHPNLQELKRSVRPRATDSSGKPRRAEVRALMRKAVKQAWRSIAALD